MVAHVVRGSPDDAVLVRRVSSFRLLEVVTVLDEADSVNACRLERDR